LSFAPTGAITAMRKKAAGKEKSVRWPSLILGSLLSNRVRERLSVTNSHTRLINASEVLEVSKGD